MNIDNPALVWFVAGILLLLAEIAVPGFIIFFFGIGALITALFAFLGVSDLSVQFIIFLSSSIIILVFLRKKWKGLFRGDKTKDAEQLEEFIGKKVIVKKDIIPGSMGGRVEFKGALWEAESDTIIKEGSVAEIIERKNISLKVKEIKN